VYNVKGIIEIKGERSLVHVRRTLRERAASLGFGLTDTTRIITAASELVRNIVIFANGGKITWEEIKEDNRSGIELVFEDEGPGIPDIEKAMKEGYSTGEGLGLGLSGARELMDEIEISSEVGKGTKITVKKWLKT
jgi:serine/threonine-protein kinase RsbT